jgi:hypothetical protein
MLMIITSAELFRQATESITHVALKGPLPRGAEVMRLVQQTLEASQPALADSEVGATGLERLAAAFRPLPAPPTPPPAARAEVGAIPGTGAGSAAASEPEAPPPPQALRLKAIMSVRGESTALVEGPNGVLTVTVGMRLGGERVVSIGDNRVVLRGPYGERVLGFDDATK